MTMKETVPPLSVMVFLSPTFFLNGRDESRSSDTWHLEKIPMAAWSSLLLRSLGSLGRRRAYSSYTRSYIETREKQSSSSKRREARVQLSVEIKVMYIHTSQSFLGAFSVVNQTELSIQSSAATTTNGRGEN